MYIIIFNIFPKYLTILTYVKSTYEYVQKNVLFRLFILVFVSFSFMTGFILEDALAAADLESNDVFGMFGDPAGHVNFSNYVIGCWLGSMAWTSRARHRCEIMAISGAFLTS